MMLLIRRKILMNLLNFMILSWLTLIKDWHLLLFWLSLLLLSMILYSFSLFLSFFLVYYMCILNRFSLNELCGLILEGNLLFKIFCFLFFLYLYNFLI